MFIGLKQLLEFEPSNQIEEIFCRSFDIHWEEFGCQKIHELIENGSNISVTGDNRQLYVDKLTDWLLNQSIQSQFDRLYAGFIKVMHPSSLLLFQSIELELLMCGTPNLDFKELEIATQYISGDPNLSWDSNHQVIRWFWDIVHSLAFEEKQKLLLFVTGSRKAPLGGLKNLGFKIQRMCPDSDILPSAHTCFNLLMLPEYGSYEKLKNRLLIAINECEGFGLK